MAIAVGSYNVEGFNSLPDFGNVGPLFDSLGGLDIVAAKMMPLFRGHGVEYDLGLTLLHRHFKLGDGERLTDIRGISVPVAFETGIPSVWALQGGDQGQLRPMEFSIERSKAPLWKQPKFQTFLREFAQVLESCGGQDIFGLCSYPGDEYPGRVEITVGRTNVNLTPMEVRKSKLFDLYWT